MRIWSFNLQKQRTNITEIRGLWHRHVPHILRGDQLPTAFAKGTSLYRGARPAFLLLPADHEIREEAALSVIHFWRGAAKSTHRA